MLKALLLFNGCVSLYTILCILATINVVRGKKDKDLLASVHGFLAINLSSFISVLLRITDHLRVWETIPLTIVATLFYCTCLYVILMAYKSFSKPSPK